MNRTRLEFDPPATLKPIRDEGSGGAGEARGTTTEEQRAAAVQYALEWMVREKVWIVEVLVRWTRTEPTVLTVRGHAEHLPQPGRADLIVPDWDEVTEATLDGDSIVRSPSEEQAMLEAELASIFETE